MATNANGRLVSTDDKEIELAQKRLARRKAAYEKFCISLERRQRKLDKDSRSVERRVKLLAGDERRRRSKQKRLARLEAEIADLLVTSTVEEKRREPEPPPALLQGPPASDDSGSTEKNAASPGEVKPKRQRKPKAGSPGPKALEEFLNKPFLEARQAREARMESMGFRKIARKR